MSIPNSLPFLVQLVQLDLSFNNISSLKSSGIEQLTNLQELDVSHNMIPTIDEVVYLFQNNKALKSLSINHNPFEASFGGQEMVKNVIMQMMPTLIVLNGVQVGNEQQIVPQI